MLKSMPNGDHFVVRDVGGRIKCKSVVGNHCWKRCFDCCSHNPCDPACVVEVDGASKALGMALTTNPETRVHKLRNSPSGMTTQ